jgi:HD-GYP domain-containing protein (c-di-GMP phosphodiesterase class II)
VHTRSRDAKRSSGRNEQHGPGRSAARIVLVYGGVATAWILASDAILRIGTVDPNLLTIVAVLKGVLFVAVTSALLFILIRGYFTHLEDAVQQLRDSKNRLQRSLESTVEVLGKVTETRDPYTAGHQRRVRQLAVAIADKMGMPEAEVAEIGIAGAVHDIGKISVPAEILTKPGSLSPVELELVHTHAQTGYEILLGAEMSGSIADLVHQHHERCDGSGYPQGLTGTEILKGAKVLMVADVVEAMSSHRPYRGARGLDAARAEIERGAGTVYDEEVCRALIDLLQGQHVLFNES